DLVGASPDGSEVFFSSLDDVDGKVKDPHAGTWVIESFSLSQKKFSTLTINHYGFMSEFVQSADLTKNLTVSKDGSLALNSWRFTVGDNQTTVAPKFLSFSPDQKRISAVIDTHFLYLWDVLP